MCAYTMEHYCELIKKLWLAQKNCLNEYSIVKCGNYFANRLFQKGKGLPT